MVIRIAAWRPGPSGRAGNAASPPRKCQRYSLVCSHVQVPDAPHPRPGRGATGPLRPRPVRLEPRRRAARPLAPRPEGRAGLPGAVPAAHRRPRGNPWLAAGSQTVQQQALRDFTRAMAALFDPANPAGRPLWRKAGRDEGFRITGRRGRQWDVRRVSRHVGQVWVPKAGWVRFRWSRAVPPGVKSYRVTHGPGGPVACRLRRDPLGGSRPPVTARSWGSTGAWRSPRPCPPGSCCTAPPWPRGNVGG